MQFWEKTYQVTRLTDSRPNESEQVDIDLLLDNETPYQLIIWNDDHNTFEWVIKALVDICGHTEEQAEQCALLIHTKGKYNVKKGDYDTLKPMCNAITDRGINATIESTIDN